jgi:hypothetical protein
MVAVLKRGKDLFKPRGIQEYNLIMRGLDVFYENFSMKKDLISKGISNTPQRTVKKVASVINCDY